MHIQFISKYVLIKKSNVGIYVLIMIVTRVNQTYNVKMTTICFVMHIKIFIMHIISIVQILTCQIQKKTALDSNIQFLIYFYVMVAN